MGFKIAFIIFISIFSVPSSHSRARTIQGAVDFKLCNDVKPSGIVSNVIVYQCTTLPCVFRRGNRYSIEIDFENNRDTKTLEVEVYGKVAGVTIPWPGLNKNGCRDIWVGSCPLYLGDYVTYGINMTVDTFYPAVELDLRWLIKGDDDKPIFCWEIPVRVA